jgi:hypothetical protein
MKLYFLRLLSFLPFLIIAGLFLTVANGLSAQDIPESAQCYFTAVAASDLSGLEQCFQPDAVIIDVNRKISGIEAILTWAENEVIGGRYEILSIESQGQDQIKLLIKFVPPGLWGKLSKGFRAHYTFDFKQGKIIRMDLQYA